MEKNKTEVIENEILTEGIIESPYNKNWVEYLFNNK